MRTRKHKATKELKIVFMRGGGAGASSMPKGADLPAEIKGKIAQASPADLKAFGNTLTSEAKAKIVMTLNAKPPRRKVDYASAETIWSALAEETEGAGPNVRLLRASWVLKQSKIDGATLARRQDLPEEAFISLAELKAMYDKSDNFLSMGLQLSTESFQKGPKCVPIIALSHFWRTKAHPDPEGVTLKFIGKALEEHMPKYASCWGEDPQYRWNQCGSIGYEDMGLFIDYCSLFQEPREKPEMMTAFKSSLAHINVWYASLLTTVYFVSDEPEGIIPYHARGWTTFEYLITWLLQWGSQKPWKMVVFASGREPWTEESLGYARYLTPSPSDVDSFLEGGEYDDKIFTNGSDRPLVARKFKEATEDIFGSVEALDYLMADWRPRDAARFAKVLRYCTKVKKITLAGNKNLGRNVGNGGYNVTPDDSGVVSLAAACKEKGVLPELEELNLFNCGIGDEGFDALAGVLWENYLPKLRLLKLAQNRASEKAKQRHREKKSGVVGLALSCSEHRPKPVELEM